MSVVKYRVCPSCYGHEEGPDHCPECHGSGYVSGRDVLQKDLAQIITIGQRNDASAMQIAGEIVDMLDVWRIT